jgi:hypothetical protein
VGYDVTACKRGHLDPLLANPGHSLYSKSYQEHTDSFQTCSCIFVTCELLWLQARHALTAFCCIVSRELSALPLFACSSSRFDSPVVRE